MTEDAKFLGAHATRAGWAIYQGPKGLRPALRCRLFGHRYPVQPETPNGYSPCCYGKCSRCHNFIKWYVIGQHPYGGMDAE